MGQDVSVKKILFVKSIVAAQVRPAAGNVMANIANK
jgi:hypothetical protein